MSNKITYEGHTFDPWDVWKWNYSGRVRGGCWDIYLCTDGKSWSFTTYKNPCKEGGLADMLTKAKGV